MKNRKFRITIELIDNEGDGTESSEFHIEGLKEVVTNEFSNYAFEITKLEVNEMI